MNAPDISLSYPIERHSRTSKYNEDRRQLGGNATVLYMVGHCGGVAFPFEAACLIVT